MKVGLLFNIEIPSGLQEGIIKMLKINSKQYNLFFSAYTWPCLILSTIGSILMDRYIGRRIGMMISSFIIMFGTAVIATGGFMNSFDILVAGRFVLGFGSTCLSNVQNAFVAVWFKENITFAMGLVFASCRLGAAMGLVTPKLLYNYINDADLPTFSSTQFKMGFTFLSGLLLALGILISTIVFVLLDIRGVNHSARPLFVTHKFSIKDLKDFSAKFWLSSISSNIFYCVFFIYVANGQIFLMGRFGFDAQQANTANLLVFASPIILTPIFGYVIQNVGWNVYWGLFGTLLGTLSHLLFNVTGDCIVVPFLLAILFAFSYSFFGISIIPLPALIVQDHQLTTAYSLFNMLYSVMYTGISVVTGTIIDRVGYMWLEVYFCLVMSVASLLLIILAVVDHFSDNTKVNKHGLWMQHFIENWKQKKRSASVKVQYNTM